MFTSRLRRYVTIGLIFVSSTVGAGCGQRNAERIGREEAASIPPPPPPQAFSPQAGGAVAESTTRIAGTIEVAPELVASVPGGGTLYLIVRVAGREGGAPLAVQQLPAPQFPFAFEITERDSMIEGTPLIGEMSITARIDQDGDAFTETPGDLSGQTSPVVEGDVDIIIVLDNQISGDAGS